VKFACVIALAACRMAVADAEYAGSRACARCHREIYESYRTTPMATSSGVATGGAMRDGAFTHAASGFRYRVNARGGGLSFEFSRGDGPLRGQKTLSYFVGSGAVARSYLIADDGFLYEAPVAYYTGTAKWDLAPGYGRYAYPFLTRPVMPACLTCHASFLQPVERTQNRYRTRPFEESGVACERCHGAGAAHAAGAGAIVNPAKLTPERRDSVCSQCHLAGQVRVMAKGADWRSYHPGDRLADSMTVFVKADAGPGMTVTGHVEKLAQSACKRAAGDRLWCGTCHDPHAVPKAAERTAWFRGKCMSCHESKPCRESTAARARAADDCTACHMPKNTVTDAQHVVYTDHSIPRRPRVAVAPVTDFELAPFGGGTASARDTALAYAIEATRGSRPALQARATEMLEKVVRDAPDDVEVLLYLAERYRLDGESERAVPLYDQAIAIDPSQVTASVGLGGIRMERGELAEAIRLWEDALAKNAGLMLVRTNLAMAYWRSGDRQSAERHLRKAIELSPGFATARELLEKMR
jgi:hypothetical protein